MSKPIRTGENCQRTDLQEMIGDMTLIAKLLLALGFGMLILALV